MQQCPSEIYTDENNLSLSTLSHELKNPLTLIRVPFRSLAAITRKSKRPALAPAYSRSGLYVPAPDRTLFAEYQSKIKLF